MALNCKHTHPLQHNGTSQNERFLESLEPGNTPVHQFDLKDWMRFAYHYGARLNYFSTTDAEKSDGNWQDFMKAEAEIETWLKDAELVADEKWLTEKERELTLQHEPQANYEPHLALFLAFLKLMKFSQAHLNDVSRKHLEFYYTRVLQLSRKPAVPDRVHILFELAKNAALETVPEKTVLDGGKPLRYQTEKELTVNTAEVALIKSVYHQKGQTVRYAEMTNSIDGLGTEFKEKNPSWNGFGNSDWPASTLGFALASKVLLMKEGKRTITVSLTLKTPDSASLPSSENFEEELQVFLSGEEEWLEVTELSVADITGDKTRVLSFVATLDGSQPAVVPYSSKIHGERFNSNLPVMRILVNTETSAGYSIYSLLSKSVILTASIDITVTGAKDLMVENDQSRLDPSKPFHPFGPLPKIDSSFYIGSNELFLKDWQEVKLNITWKDKPGDLKDYYSSYLEIDPSIDTFDDKDDPFVVISQYINNNSWYPDLEYATELPLFSSPITIEREPADVTKAPPSVPPLIMQKGVNVNKAVLRNYLSTDTPEKSGKKAKISARFEAAHFNPGFSKLATTTTTFSAATKSGFIRLVLQEDFLHDDYPKILTQLMMDRAKKKPLFANTTVPNTPYTPEINSLSLDYKAGAENSFNFDATTAAREKYDNFTTRSIQLFHEHPFGQAEQHIFLKEQSDFLEDPTAARALTVMPPYTPEGELYIGLKNAQPSGSLALLLAAVEGSEDPQAPTFSKDQHIGWYSLTNNEWQSLNQSFLTSDETNNLLRPGIITMNLPASINASNTLLDDGYYWLRLQLPDGLQHSSVCKLAGIHAQAVTALFKDGDSEPSHLASALPAKTISKAIGKPALIKSLTQPYSSFGGALEETEQAFNLRVSERLRHKQRAITIWDYERLVLQQFPTIHKVKCISHTFTPTESGDPDYCEVSPGNVSLVVIPDIRNKNLYNPLQPAVSQNTLSEIEQFLDPLTGLHTNCIATNPEYEKVVLDFRVKFHNRYDAIAYNKILNEDIVRYLSPWAFGEYSSIQFGGSLYKSVIIHFVEELEYVDFISQFRMYHRIGEQDNNIQDKSEIVASNSRAILVSNPEHRITTIENDKVCDE